MDVLNLACKLGKVLQEDDCYVNYRIAEQNKEADKVLQDLLGEFNLIKINIDNEKSKSKPDEAKIDGLETDLQACYEAIMKNESMIEFNKTKLKLEILIKKINAIISGSILGEDPFLIDIDNIIDCSKNCNGCSKCK